MILKWLKARLRPEAPLPQKLLCEFKWGPLDGRRELIWRYEWATGGCCRMTRANRRVLYVFGAIDDEEGSVDAMFQKYLPVGVLK